MPGSAARLTALLWALLVAFAPAAAAAALARPVGSADSPADVALAIGTSRPRPPAVRVCFGASGLCLLAAALLAAWESYAQP